MMSLPAQPTPDLPAPVPAGTAPAPAASAQLARSSPAGSAGELRATAGTAERVAAAFLLSHHGHTRAAYARDLLHYYTWCAQRGVDVLTAGRPHLDAYVEDLRESGARPATIGRRLAAVSGLYEYAVDERLTDRNPAARVRRPRVGENVQSTGLSAAEAHALLGAADADGPRAAVVVQLLLLCGLRVSEVCGARVEQLGHQRGHRVLTVTRKNGRDQTMVLAPRTVATLTGYLGERTSGPLVVTSTGRGMDRHAVWRLLRKLAGTALPHLAGTLHPHDLRHACATLALDAGASLRDVQDLLGHADPRTTRRYDRARHNLDRSPTYALAALLAQP